MQGFFLKSYIEERAMEIAKYIIDNNTTVRQAAKHFGISKSTVHNDISKKLKNTNRFLYYQVYKILDNNLKLRHIRGGEATKLMYKRLSVSKKSNK